MKREFASRDELIAYVRQQFPEAAARDSSVPPTPGGRQAAETLLQQVDPSKYSSTRNFLNGAVTRLSPYLRYGVLSLAEVRDAVLAKVHASRRCRETCQRVGLAGLLAATVRRIGQRDLARPGTLQNWLYCFRDYSETLPQDVIEGTTGLAFASTVSAASCGKLVICTTTSGCGWLAYLVHWRKRALASRISLVFGTFARWRSGKQQSFLAVGSEHF